MSKKNRDFSGAFKGSTLLDKKQSPIGDFSLDAQNPSHAMELRAEPIGSQFYAPNPVNGCLE